MQCEGFLIALDSRIYLENFEARSVVQQHPEEYAHFQEAFRAFTGAHIEGHPESR